MSSLEQCWHALEAWSSASASGLVALNSLQVVLSEMHACQEVPVWPPIIDEIKAKAPSKRLFRYLEGSPAGNTELLTTLSDSFDVLSSASSASQSASARLTAVAEEATQQAVADSEAFSTSALPEEAAGTAAAPPPTLLDQALLLLELADGVTKQTAYQAAIIDSLDMETAPSTFSGYALFWETRPYVDADLKTRLQRWLAQRGN